MRVHFRSLFVEVLLGNWHFPSQPDLVNHPRNPIRTLPIINRNKLIPWIVYHQFVKSFLSRINPFNRTTYKLRIVLSPNPFQLSQIHLLPFLGYYPVSVPHIINTPWHIPKLSPLLVNVREVNILPRVLYHLHQDHSDNQSVLVVPPKDVPQVRLRNN